MRDKRLIAHDLGREGQLMPGEGLIDDDDRQPCGGHILLRPGVNEAVARHVHGL